MSLTQDIREVRDMTRVIECNVSRQSEILAVNTSSLATHIRRTELLEIEVRGMRKFNYILIGIFSALQVLLPIILKLGGF